MTTLKDVLHSIADRVRHADEASRMTLHRDIDALADDVERGVDYVDPPAAGDDPAIPGAAGAGATPPVE